MQTENCVHALMFILLFIFAASFCLVCSLFFFFLFLIDSSLCFLKTKVFGHFMGGGGGVGDDATGKGAKKGKGKAGAKGGGGGGRTRMAESTEDAAMLKGALQVLNCVYCGNNLDV